MKKKILLIAHSFVVPRYREGVANELAKNKKYDIRVFSPSQFYMFAGKPFNFEVGKNEKYEVITGKTLFNKKSSFMIYTSNLLKTIKEWKPDVIDIFDEAPWGWSVAQITLYRNLFSPSTKISLFVDNNIDRKWKGIRFFYKYIENYTLSNADRVYVPMQKSGFEQIVRTGGYKGKISYIPGSIDVNLFKPRKGNEISSIKTKLGLKKEDIVLGIVGGLGKYNGYYPKGTPAAINACSQLPSNYKLLLIGAGNKDNLTELKEIAKQNGISPNRIYNTDFIPFDKMPLYYNVLDIVLALSVPRSDWAEPCGRMQLEGMASGIPVVATDCGSNKEIVKGAGIVVKVNDDKAIAKGVLEITKNARVYKKYSLAARKRAIEAFSIESITEKRERIYEELTKIKK